MREIIANIYQIFCLVMAAYGLYFGLVSAFFLLKRKAEPEPEGRLRFAVLVAARNEESCISGIVESIKNQNYPSGLADIYVIPNNCSDRTAEVARAAGAEIIEVSPAVSSKGQALHEAFAYLLANENHDAYCVFDADNEAHPDFLAEMNRSLSRHRAAKSRILAKNAHQGWVCACYETYFCNANLMLNRARKNLGLSARLIGTGFALRRDLMEELGGWNTETLTEDAEFYALLSIRGERIDFAQKAITYDEEPLSFRQSVVQRRRWMSGVMEVARKKAPALLSGILHSPGRGFAADALLQLSFCWMQALTIPIFLLWLCFLPREALSALPGAVLSFYASTFFIGLLALAAEARLSRFTLPALFLYPLFIFSFLPLQTMSMFLPNKKWVAIRHSGVRLQSSGMGQ